jgi:hypothetical protein
MFVHSIVVCLTSSIIQFSKYISIQTILLGIKLLWYWISILQFCGLFIYLFYFTSMVFYANFYDILIFLKSFISSIFSISSVNFKIQILLYIFLAFAKQFVVCTGWYLVLFVLCVHGCVTIRLIERCMSRVWHVYFNEKYSL